MQEYFKLFKETFLAIKAYDSRFKVGGPAVCGVKDDLWIRSFLEFCKENNLHPDSVTRHHYTVEFPENVGHYDYSKLMNAEDGFKNLQSSRDIIDSFDEYRGLPIHITEFSTSYTPKGVIHDTNLNAACLAEQLSRLGEMNESYSYWTFGDVFEEQGVPFSLFHGGFGLVAAGSIPKPTFWTFAFYKKLKDKSKECVLKDEASVVVRTESGYAGVIWNKDKAPFVKAFSLAKGDYTLVTKTVDEECCNPLKAWHDLGEPASLTKEQLSIIKESASPLTKTAIIDEQFEIKADRNAVVYFELTNRKFTPDRGYDYERVINFH